MIYPPAQGSVFPIATLKEMMIARSDYVTKTERLKKKSRFLEKKNFDAFDNLKRSAKKKSEFIVKRSAYDSSLISQGIITKRLTKMTTWGKDCLGFFYLNTNFSSFYLPIVYFLFFLYLKKKKKYSKTRFRKVCFFLKKKHFLRCNRATTTFLVLVSGFYCRLVAIHKNIIMVWFARTYYYFYLYSSILPEILDFFFSPVFFILKPCINTVKFSPKTLLFLKAMMLLLILFAFLVILDSIQIFFNNYKKLIDDWFHEINHDPTLMAKWDAQFKEDGGDDLKSTGLEPAIIYPISQLTN